MRWQRDGMCAFVPMLVLERQFRLAGVGEPALVEERLVLIRRQRGSASSLCLCLLLGM